MSIWKSIPWLLLPLFSPVLASFNAYALYDHQAVSNALGISSQCLSALNYTVDCDSVTSARAARGLDEEYWFQENITSLCTPECADSLELWLATVENECKGDKVLAKEVLVEPKIFPLKYMTGYKLACMQDSEENWCFYDSQSWDSSPYLRWDGEMGACYGEDPPIICDEEEGFSIAENIPDSMTVQNIYGKDLYCSECFLLLWRQRLQAPVLPPGNLTDYLITQFGELEAACSTSMPFTTSTEAFIFATPAPSGTTVASISATPTPKPRRRRQGLASRRATTTPGTNETPGTEPRPIARLPRRAPRTSV